MTAPMPPVTPCSICRRPMIPAKPYRKDPAAWSASGFVGADPFGSCRGCCSRMRRGQTGPSQAPGVALARFVLSFALLAARGLSQETIALRLGMTFGAVYNAVARARARGLLPPSTRRPPSERGA